MSQENVLRTLLENDKVILGASCGLYSTTAIEILGERDLDFLFLDFEHNGPSIGDSLTIQEYVRAADQAAIELMVRLPSVAGMNYGPTIRKVLDTGVRTLVVPRIETASEVRAFIMATRFRYDDHPGDRGVGAARGSRWGADIDRDWIDQEDESVLCGIMVETAAAVENIEEIVAIDGLDFVLIGSMDLSVALGVPTETTHPRFEQAVEQIRIASQEAGISFGQLGAPNLDAAELIQSGAQIVRLGSDIGALRNGFRDQYSNLRDHTFGRSR